MKITKARLQEIIKEEIAAIREEEEPEQLELPFNIKHAQLAHTAKLLRVPLDELKAVVDPNGSASLEELGALLDDTMYKANRMMTSEEKYDVSSDERFATMGQYMIRILRGEG